MDFSVLTELESGDIAWEMSKQLTHKEMLEFIINLDGLIADWSFTEMIYEWAHEQHKIFKVDKKEYGD